MLYDSSLKQKWDNKNMLDYAVKEAEKIARESFVKNLIQDTDFDDQKIASLASVDTTFVENVRRGLK